MGHNYYKYIFFAGMVQQQFTMQLVKDSSLKTEKNTLMILVRNIHMNSFGVHAHKR